MTDLHKPVKRITDGLLFEKGKPRQVIITLMPPQLLRFRLKGTRRSYDLTATDCYKRAVLNHIAAEKVRKAKEKKNKKHGA